MKIVTVCGCGLGTCLLLKMTCEKALKELGVTNFSVLHGDLGSMINEKCDFYVITTDMEEKFKSLNKKYASVKNVASVDEMKTVLNSLMK